MYKGKLIALVVPAYNEERFIIATLNTVPEFVDRIFVIDDASQDSTIQLARDFSKVDPRITTTRLETNSGVGSAVVRGYKLALQEKSDIVARMDGDNQMPPLVLYKLLDPIIGENADYSKGNRLSNAFDRKQMPKFRLLGNTLLTFLTRFASGYWEISDPQNGFTAISTNVLRKIDLNDLRKDFTFENDLLVHLNVIGAKVVDVPHSAIYAGQSSKIKYHTFIFAASWGLFSSWINRLRVKQYRNRQNAT